MHQRPVQITVHRRQQMRGMHRLRDVAVHARLQTTLHVTGHGMRGHRDYRQLFPARILPDQARSFQPSSTGICTSIRIRSKSPADFELCQRLSAVVGQLDRQSRVCAAPWSPLSDLPDCPPPPAAGPDPRPDLRRRGWPFDRPVRRHRDLTGQRYDERGASPNFALDMDFAAMQFHQFLRDGEPQAGSAVLTAHAASACVNLSKISRVGWNSGSAVLHLD